MKKRLFVSLALALAVMFGYAMQASACHVERASIVADCEDVGGEYFINYEITAYSDSGSLSGVYFLEVDGVDITPLYPDNIIELPSCPEGGSVTGSYGPIDCGIYTLKGTVTGGYPPPPTTATFGPVDVTCPCPECQSDLIAGQNWDSPAGVVTVWEEWVDEIGYLLHVKFETTDDWILGETHLYVGIEPPTKSAPGKFPYKAKTEYIIPLDDFFEEADCGDTLYIAAHAVVSQDGQQEETAGADTYGIPFGKGWAMYFPYWVCYGCEEPPQ